MAALLRSRRAPARPAARTAASALLLAASAALLLALAAPAAADSTAGAWAQCGGSGVDAPWAGVGCPAGYSCQRLDEFFWRCAAAKRPRLARPQAPAPSSGGGGGGDVNLAEILKALGPRPRFAQPPADGAKEEDQPSQPAAAGEPAGAPAGPDGAPGPSSASALAFGTAPPPPAPEVKVADWGQCGGLAGCRTPDRPCAQRQWPGYSCGQGFTCTRIDGYWFQCRDDQLAVKQAKVEQKREEQLQAKKDAAEQKKKEEAEAPPRPPPLDGRSADAEPALPERSPAPAALDDDFAATTPAEKRQQAATADQEQQQQQQEEEPPTLPTPAWYSQYSDNMAATLNKTNPVEPPPGQISHQHT